MHEIFIAWRPINHHLQTARPPSHTATPELLQLLTPDSLACIAHPPRRMSDAGFSPADVCALLA